jgi:UDP-N-acetylmuramoyl-tripeptide--D-alanyl-D-alanine ligase
MPGYSRLRLTERMPRLVQLLRSRVGRDEVFYAGLNKAWPVLSTMAAAHRRLLGRRTRLVVVVGSFGKTTTTRCITAALGLSSRWPRDNCRSHLAVAALRDTGFAAHYALEVGIDHPGQMERYARMLRPDVVVVTSIGSEHSRSFGDLAATRREKGAMLKALRPGGLAVINGDDPNVLAMAAETTARTIVFGTTAGCDVRASRVTLDWPTGTRFEVESGDGRVSVALRLLGRVTIYPALAALAVARELGFPLARAADRLAHLEPAPGRLQPVAIAGGVTLICDEFKSSAETIYAALDLLAEVPARRRWVVLGDVSEPPGKQGPVYRAIGERLAGIVDHAVFVGRMAERYSVGAHRAGLPRAAIARAGQSVAAATELIRGRLEPGDVVLIKGRDNQRLERIALALMGREVRCDLRECYFLKTRCGECSLLGDADSRARTSHAFPRRG